MAKMLKKAEKLVLIFFLFNSAQVFSDIPFFHEQEPVSFKDYVKQAVLKREAPNIYNYSDLRKAKFEFADNEIVFGQTLSYSGLNSVYARQIFCGTASCFMATNENNGILGKYLLRLVPVDDRGDPLLCLKIERRLLKKHKIECFFGSMGERSLLALLPEIKQENILMLFPHVFNKRFRRPSLKNVINGMNNKEVQINKILDFLVHQQKFKQIAIFYPKDEMGIYLNKYTQMRLGEMRVKPVASVCYNPKQMEIVRSSQELKDVGPEAVICLGSFMPSCRLITQFLRGNLFSRRAVTWLGNDVEIQHDSPETIFIGTEDMYYAAKILENCMEDYCSNIYFCSLVPLPNRGNFNYKIVRQYLQSLQKYFPEEQPSPLGLSYFINAKLTVKVLEERLARNTQRFTPTLLKNLLIKGFRNINYYDLGGFVASCIKDGHSSVYPLQPYVFNLRKKQVGVGE